MTRTELTLGLRRGESLLVTLAIPLGILVFFSTLDVLPDSNGSAIGFLVPGVMALAVASNAMVALGIATGFERQQGVLKRLGSTPLGRTGLLAAKISTVGVLLVAQMVAIAAMGSVLGWRPAGSAALAAALIALGTVAFAGIGAGLAGRLRAETNLAAANGLFLVMLLLGGVVAPVDRLPGPLDWLARLLPTEPLATGLRSALGSGTVSFRIVATLAAWAAAACLATAWTFRWDP